MITIIEIYHRLRALRICGSQREFSRMAGKQPSWFSSTVARGRIYPTISTLLILQHRIRMVLRDAQLAAAHETICDSQAELSITTEALRDLLMSISAARDSHVLSLSAE